MTDLAYIHDLDADGPIPVRGDDGSTLGELHRTRIGWDCADARLEAQLLAIGPIAAPAAEASEPVTSAIARLVQVARASGALLAVGNPAAAIGPDKVGLAQGVRLFGIATEADESCWDAALSVGLPIYGLRGQLRIDLSTARRKDLSAVQMALAYGLYTCGEGLQPEQLDEDRAGVSWRFARDDVRASVIVKGGFEAAAIDGAEGAWRDRGSEGYVRLAFVAGDARCWSQPRLVVPTGAAHG